MCLEGHGKLLVFIVIKLHLTNLLLLTIFSRKQTQTFRKKQIQNKAKNLELTL